MIEIMGSQITFFTILLALTLIADYKNVRTTVNIKDNVIHIVCQSKLHLTAPRILIYKPRAIVIPHYSSCQPFKIFPNPNYS